MNLNRAAILVLFYYVFQYIYYASFSAIPRVTFLNVGQGDSSLLILSKSTSILIDGGPDMSLEYEGLSNYTYPWCNITTLFLSHFHADHSKGIPNIFFRCSKSLATFNDIHVMSYDASQLKGMFSDNLFFTNHPNFISSSLSGNILYYKTAGNFDVTIYTIWPPNTYQSLKEENDRSLILLVDIGPYEILYSGDASGKVLEKALTPAVLELIDGRLEVYKVSHHGSSTGRSRKVLEVLRPLHCVISVGKNSFGHPSPIILSDLTEYGCKVHRTDLEGNIEFRL